MIQNYKIDKNELICGILILKSKYHYGFNKRKIPYYLFKSINKDYPDFLVAFSKSFKYNNNIYINIKFKEWVRKIPYGTCENVIGEIDNKNSEYEFLLYKYNIFQKTFKLDKNLKKIFKNGNILEIFSKELKNYNKLENINIISVDPKGSKDIDDAISYQKCNENYKIGIHIADPGLFIKKFNLLDKVNNRISTIYCKHRKINMLPNIFSDNYISLIEKLDRFSLTLWINLDKSYKIIDYFYEKCLININQNYTYEEFDKEYKNNNYLKKIFDISKFISKDMNLSYKYDEWNSHKMIEIYMLLANNLTAKFINKYSHTNILRIHQNSKTLFKDLDKYDLDKKLINFLNIYQSNSAVYKIRNIDDDNNYYHYGLNLKEYTHFTSPIRRLIDIYIHFIIKSILNNEKMCINNLENIIKNVNNFNNNIKKMKKDSNKLNIFFNNNFDVYYGYVIEIKYNCLKIYIPELNYLENIKLFDDKLLNMIVISNNEKEINIYNNENSILIKLYQKIKIKIYSNNKQNKLLNKIKIKIIEPNIDLFIY